MRLDRASHCDHLGAEAPSHTEALLFFHMGTQSRLHPEIFFLVDVEEKLVEEEEDQASQGQDIRALLTVKTIFCLELHVAKPPHIVAELDYMPLNRGLGVVRDLLQRSPVQKLSHRDDSKLVQLRFCDER